MGYDLRILQLPPRFQLVDQTPKLVTKRFNHRIIGLLDTVVIKRARRMCRHELILLGLRIVADCRIRGLQRLLANVLESFLAFKVGGSEQPIQQFFRIISRQILFWRIERQVRIKGVY